MRPSAHRITADQVRALADGTSTNTETGILLRAQRSKTLATLELVARQAMRDRHPGAAAAAGGRDLLARVQSQAPAAAEELLRYPAVGSWSIATLLGLGSPDPGRARPERLALVAAAAAIRGGVRAAVNVPVPEHGKPSLHFPSLGTLDLPGGARGGTAMLRVRDGAAEVQYGQDVVRLPANLEARGGWRPLAAVTAGAGPDAVRLVLDDTDPFRLPGYAGDPGPLTASETEQWRGRIQGGWHLLAIHHPRTAADVRAVLSAIAPLSSADGGRRSVTSRYVFGTTGLSLPDDDVSMALTLAHEVQHAKLCALMDMMPLVAEEHDRSRRLYYAPWRPDHRPLASLLQGLYAYLGVTRFWCRQRAAADGPAEIHRASVEFERWRDACSRVSAVAGAQPELTRCGAVFASGMVRAVQGWRRERVSPEARAEACRDADEHWKLWGQISREKVL